MLDVPTQPAEADVTTHAIKIEFTDGHKTHEYGLGLGPCGRIVTSLNCQFLDNRLIVMQWVEGEEGAATFVYPMDGVRRYTVYDYDPNVCPLNIN